MTDAAIPPVKTPKHLWVVGILAVLWNAIGALDFTMTQLNSEAWLKGFTAEQRAYFDQFPLWVEVSWGAGVYGGFIGSILLLARKSWALRVFWFSIVGVIGTSIYSYGLSDGMKVMQSGVGAAIFSAVIFIIAVLLYVYARAMTKRGVLR